MADKRTRTKLLVVVGVILAVGLWFRLGGLFTDFWLDEIWGLKIASKINSPIEIFTAIHFDTNHWLYTFLLWASGDQPMWLIYRLPSFLAGVLTVLLLPLVSLAKSPLTRFLTLLLASFSFPLIFYSSEARGYALLLLFSVVAFYLLGKFLSRSDKYLIPLFWLSCTLGFLSHLTYVFVWIALFAWSAFSLWRKSGWQKASLGLIQLYAVPGILFIALYLVDIRKIEHGGGDVSGLFTVLGQLAGWLTGLPAGKWFGLVGIILCCVIGGTEIIRLKREQSDLWVFFLVLFLAAFGIPIVTGIRTKFEYWVARHFIVCVPFFVLLLANLLGRCLGKDHQPGLISRREGWDRVVSDLGQTNGLGYPVASGFTGRPAPGYLSSRQYRPHPKFP